jgi:hypothetical protein
MYQAMSRDATGNADGAQTNQGTFGGGGGQFWGHPNTASATTGISINNGTASVTIGSSGSGTDTRPVNLALLACIKY